MRIIIASLASILISACAPEESLTPIYPAEDYKFETITLTIPTVFKKIEPVETTGLRRFIYKIPVLNKFIAIPFDITNALVPKIPLKNDTIDLKDEDVDSWADPEFLRLVKSLKITKGWVRERSDEEILAEGHELGAKKSWFCKSRGIEFIKEMTVRFQFQDKNRPHSDPSEFPIAFTNNSNKYFKEIKKTLDSGNVVTTKMFTFEVLDRQLIGYMGDINNFKLKLQVDGNIPCERVYLEAGIEVQVVLQVKK